MQAEYIAELLKIEPTKQNLIRIQRGIELVDEVEQITTHIFSIHNAMPTTEPFTCGCDYWLDRGQGHYCIHLIAVIVYKELYKK